MRLDPPNAVSGIVSWCTQLARWWAFVGSVFLSGGVHRKFSVIRCQRNSTRGRGGWRREGGGVEATKMGVEENLQATLVSAAVCGVRQSVEDCEKSCFSTTGDESITFNLSIFNKKR